MVLDQQVGFSRMIFGIWLFCGNDKLYDGKENVSFAVQGRGLH